MKAENIIEKKTYDFSLRIIKLYLYLIDRKVDYSLCKQLLKSGTSIGANVAEAQGSFSKKEFIVKLQISYKETKETLYWLKLMRDSSPLEERLASNIIKDCEEILRILSSIIKTSKRNG